MVGARLRSVVRRARSVRRGLGEQLLTVERQIAIDLARRDVMETADPDSARGLEQRLRTDHIGAKEDPGIENRETVVRLGGEVHDHVDPMATEELLRQIEVADVTLHEADA